MLLFIQYPPNLSSHNISKTFPIQQLFPFYQSMMLPYITQPQPKKKPPQLGTQQLLKQQAQLKKQLQTRSKVSVSRIPPALTADFFKICRLKQIPQFYSNYLLLAVERSLEEKIGEVLGTEVREIINHRSCYHKISDVLEERVTLLRNVCEQLEVCEGFQDMNIGKAIKPANRNKINQLLKQATSLEDIKNVESKAVAELAGLIVKVRKNTVLLLQEVRAWRQYLVGIASGQKKNKIKIVFPASGINCVLLPLFDQLPILNSFLCREFNMNRQQNPFIMIGKEAKRKNQFQALLKQQLAKDDYNYEFHVQEILAELPVKEDPNKREREIQEEARQREEQKIKSLKQIKEKQKMEEKQREKQSKRKQKQEADLAAAQSPKNRKNKQKSLNKKSKSLMDIESILLKHKQKRKKNQQNLGQQNANSKITEIEQQNKSLLSPTKKDKNILNIYGSAKQKQDLNSSDDRIKDILNEKAKLQKQLKQAKTKNKQFQKLIKKIQKSQTQQPKKSSTNDITDTNNNKTIQQKSNNVDERVQFQNKVQAVYKARHSKKISGKVDKNLNNSQLSVQELINDKKSLEKQLKSQIRERQSLQRLLKKSQGQITKKLDNSRLQKSQLQQKIHLLESKVQQTNSPRSLKQQQQPLTKSKASIISIYMAQNPDSHGHKKSDPITNLYESKLVEEKQKRLSLEKQMKDLMKEKTKLEKSVEKSQSMMSKEKEAIEKKVEKYEETIQKLKLEHSEFKLLKNQASLLETKKSQSLRMYTTTPMKTQSKQKKESLPKRLNQHIKSANYFKLPPQIKKSNAQRQKTIQQKEQQIQKPIISSRSINKVQIIQTKKTIQIIYEAAKRSKNKKKSQSENQISEQKLGKTLDNEEMEKIKKEKQILQVQLQREEARRLREEKALERKALKQEGQVQKYKQIIERQRERKSELQNKIKNLKKQLYQQFEQRLQNQKLKFQQQKRQLMVMIQTQKGQKQLKQKYLNNQIKFLKEMQSNQNQLLKLLQLQKRNRLQKQRELAAQISKKQQLLQIIQLQQIKKGIETEIRKQLQNAISEQDSQELDLEERKDQLRQEIQEMNEERNVELEEIDEQNEKLKALIARIKDQESKLVSAIKENINEGSDGQQEEEGDSVLKTEERQARTDNERYHSAELGLRSNRKQDAYNSDVEIRQLEKSKISQKSRLKSKEQQKVDLEETQKIFQSRLKRQLDHEEKMHKQFQKIKTSPQYKGKEQVQNIIEMYLQNPHQYPPKKNRDYSPEQKKQIETEVLNKSKMAGDFQKQLMQLKEVQKFVPTADDDIMTSHLLNLKRVYQEKQSSALKEELFPSIKYDENYHDQDLSFESEETPPPKTIREHVELHAKNFPSKKGNNSKNFLSINRMRVAMLEQKRREAEKQLIQDEAKRRAQAEVLKRVLRAKQEERMRRAEQKKKKLQEIQKQNDKKQGKKKTKPIKKKQQTSQDKDKPKDNQQHEDQTKKDERTIKQHHEQSHQQKQEKASNDEAQQQEANLQNNNQENKQEQQNANQEQQDHQQFDTNLLDPTNAHTSLDRQKKQLESDVYRYQDQIRSFVSREDKYDIYQQFVESSEIDSYIANIISISSQEIKGLNNNQTIYKDIPGYTSLLILIAKDKVKQVEVGIGVFHKQYTEGLYICDYVLAHNMRNFLNLIFNFSRYMFKVDSYTNKIQFFFDLNKLQDEISIIHFIEFEDKCKRMGEVYVKVGADKTRKYALRRNLFEPADREFQGEGMSVNLEVGIEVHSDLIRQRGYGFQNSKNLEYFSTTALASTYMCKNEETLAVFRKNAQDDLKYRQLLLTTLMFQKKQIHIKNCQLRDIDMQQRLSISKNLHNSFTIQDPTHPIQQLKLQISHPLPSSTKRCTFQLQSQSQQINYLITYPTQAVTKIQSSNSSQIGIFLNMVPKYKVLIIEAGEFLEMHRVNPEINTFFYVKHFVKNIVDVGKEEHARVFVPEVVTENVAFLKDLSDRMKLGIFAREKIKFGWNNRFNNSLIFTPSHKDLVIKKPFILSVMSAVVERAIEGTPLCATLIE